MLSCSREDFSTVSVYKYKQVLKLKNCLKSKIVFAFATHLCDVEALQFTVTFKVLVAILQIEKCSKSSIVCLINNFINTYML